MAAKLLKGITVVKAMEAGLSARAKALAAVCPKLAIARVGGRPDDETYERGAIKRCESVGIKCETHVFERSVSNREFLRALNLLSSDGAVHGVLVMSPLPASIDRAAVRAAIDPEKDVDCMGGVNSAKLFEGDLSGHAPCTPSAVLEMLRFFKIPISGSRVTIVGRSLVVGKPLAMLLLAENATVTICHTRTVDLEAECRRADILIAAAGKASMIGAGHIKPGAAVIDVGVNAGDDGVLRGDVDFEAASALAGHITPVPGGVGTVTPAILARNTLDACERLLTARPR